MYYNLGKLQLLNGDAAAAIDTFTKVIQDKPSYGLAYANRGVAFKERKDFLRAAEDFRKALSLLKEPRRVAAVNRHLEEVEAKLKAVKQPAPPPEMKEPQPRPTADTSEKETLW
jgi:tetratricopeptide (TPR) repeat protein